MIYVSDHGDMNGEHGFYGKNTFYEASVHVPMIFAGAGIPRGKEVRSPVSLLDLGPTICRMTDAPLPPKQDGRCLSDLICGTITEEDRIVVSEVSHRFGASSIGRMAKWRQYKYVTFSGFDGEDRLYDLAEDPYETRNVIRDHPAVAERLSGVLKAMKTPDLVLAELAEQKANLDLISRCRQEGAEEWACPEGLATEAPEPMIATKIEFSF